MNGQGQASSPGASDWLLGAFKQNPEGLLLLAAGCALLLRKSSAGSGAWSGGGATATFDSGGLRRTTDARATGAGSEATSRRARIARTYSSTTAVIVKAAKANRIIDGTLWAASVKTVSATTVTPAAVMAR